MKMDAYQVEFGLTSEIDPKLMDSAIRGVRNRFPGMKFVPATSRRSSRLINVRISVPTAKLISAAFGRGCSTTEFLASLMVSAQESADKSNLLGRGLRSNLLITENPCRLSSYVQYDGTDGLRKHSRIFCNLGEVYLPEEVASNIYSLDFRIVRLPGHGSACTAVNFGGRTIINCSRRTREHNFEYFFFEELCAAGLDPVVESPCRSAQPEIVMAYSAL